MASSVKTVGVIGTGTIGASWTALFLSKGIKVIVSDPAPGAKENLHKYLQNQWPMLERLGLHESASINNWEFVDDVVNHLDNVDYIQENGPENVEFKSKLFARIDAAAKPGVVIASSSSGLPSSSFISGCKNDPSRILIGHPFNPPHLVPLVEVVPHPQTSESSIVTALDFYKLVGKSPIRVNIETPGFLANRIQAAVLMEAYSLVSRGVASAQDVDTAMTTGLGLRWALTGPYMTNILGGGGGVDGFEKLVTKLGPAIASWVKDMEEHRYVAGEGNFEKINNSVKDVVRQTDLEKLEKERDDLLVQLIAMKQNAKNLN